MDFGFSHAMRIGVRLLRATAGAALSSLLTTAGHGQTSGMAALSNGAIVEWRIEEEGGDGPSMGLAVPAFARWTQSAFDVPVTAETRSEGHAVADAWQVSFHRAGDTEFARPLRRFRGDASTLGDPVEWDGRVEEGPALRPGETVVARFEIRDVAGNVDRAEPQELLVARYAMPAERRSIASALTERTRLLTKGAPPASRGIPVRGAIVVLTVTDWLDPEGPRASGIRFRQRGKRWTLSQILLPGPREIVIQSARPVIGGTRMIPVGVVSVAAPPARPLDAGVKGTGRLVRMPLTDATLSSGDFLPETMVPGRAAISRPLTNRDRHEDRLALALIDAAAPATLAVDRRRRMALLVDPGAAAGAWPAGTAPRPPAAPAQRRVSEAVDVSAAPMLAHTDIVPGSLHLATGAGVRLEPGRDYAVDDAEGRILLTASTLSRLATDPGTVLEASYAVRVFGGSVPGESGPGEGDTWAQAASARDDGRSGAKGEGGLFGRILRAVFGGE